MGRKSTEGPLPGNDSSHRTVIFLILSCALFLFIGIWLKLRHNRIATDVAQTSSHESFSPKSSGLIHPPLPHSSSTSKPAIPPEEIVASKVIQFARNRRAIAEAMGRRDKMEMPDEVKRFFAAAEDGRWEELDVIFKSLRDVRDHKLGLRDNPLSVALPTFWPAVLDTYGVAEAAHSWPAQKLLDYGQDVLGSLRPDMVYVGGTDPGRWIPTLLNETSEGEHHIVLTQNGLAAGDYLDYLDFQYHDRFSTLTAEDSKNAFQDYLTDVQKRLQHDQQFPNEPKQVRPGENINITDGRTAVSGQDAVMAVNERLLQMLLEKNPNLSFALEESFPLKSTYADATPLGPLMELRAQDAQTTFTAERATQTLDYWNAATQKLLSDPEASGSSDTMKTYSHDAVAQANLLAAHNFDAEAEQAYHLANQLWPENPEPVSALSEILFQNGHPEEARQLIDDFMRNHPDARPGMEKLRGSSTTEKPN
ncbi:tetratricopeptide repeat protein [Pedosphaera parvula]|uniref:Uncharacterized protein n=1 Tax=Pedosphaera parvula (strain Ellin514) TaxID=320771 RepID=B9XJF3_PEDPL|nr:tetratricopeptide repeat protein [Pedosphaera parvula]EEF60014.1 hypothetical protein Cflav_PD3073 [Pedosphaera parvula Ellin514]